ncbi:MAG: hypothetical protein RL139_884, partial [Gemmatimonadota bacterium]
MSIDLGLDISTPIDPDTGLPDLDPFFGLVDGIEQLAQALHARIVTPTGALLDDLSFGHDVRENLNDSDPSAARIAAAVRSQWLADERVLDAQVGVTFADETLRIEGFVESSAGPFR